MEVAPEDREKKRLIVYFSFKVMPPATFQRLMENVLSDPTYLDDIIIFSSSIDEHLERLAEVLNRLRNAGLKLKPAKCHLLKKSLGHVSDKGIEMDPAKVKCILDWPTPVRSSDNLSVWPPTTGNLSKILQKSLPLCITWPTRAKDGLAMINASKLSTF